MKDDKKKEEPKPKTYRNEATGTIKITSDKPPRGFKEVKEEKKK